MIYAIQAGEGGPIKFGVSKNPWNRLKELQTGCPHRLTLFGALDLPHGLERSLHNQISGSRLIGEWFQLTDEVKEVLSGCEWKQYWSPGADWQHRGCARKPSEPCAAVRVGADQGGIHGLSSPGTERVPGAKARKQRWDRDKYRAYMKMHMAVTRAVKAGRAEWLKP